MSARTIGARASRPRSRISAACRARCSATMRARSCSAAIARPGRSVFHPAYLAFCRDWDVQPRACAPYRARTKGKTEAGVKYVKRNGLADQAFDVLRARSSAPRGVDGRRRSARATARPMKRRSCGSSETSGRPCARCPLRALPRREQRLRRRVAHRRLRRCRHGPLQRAASTGARPRRGRRRGAASSGSFTGRRSSRRTRDRASRSRAWSTGALRRPVALGR